MSFATQTRRAVETALDGKIPSALSPRPRTIRERLASGIPCLDDWLEGGLPVGAIAELVGPTGSGRTTTAVAYSAAAGRASKVAAWVDVSDSFDPVSAALNGMELSRLLWVRCKPSPPEAQANEPALMLPRADDVLPHVTGGSSCHPRYEMKGMPEAIRSVLQAHGGLQDHQTRRERKIIGTPGAPNRLLTKSPHREEQTPTDRRPSRKAAQHVASFEPRCAEPQTHQKKTEQSTATPTVIVQTSPRSLPKQTARTWTALDCALRATDLLLQAGGFGLIVLDLGDTPPEMSWRIPLATWFRYRAACDRSRTSLLLLTKHPCARSSAELVARLRVGDVQAEGKALTGFSFLAEIERQRFSESKVVSIRKPPGSQRPGAWSGRTSWAV